MMSLTGFICPESATRAFDRADRVFYAVLAIWLFVPKDDRPLSAIAVQAL